LIRDGDGVYGERVTRRIESLGIDEVITVPASPWQNAYVERVIGTLRRELFDHVIVLNERHLKRLMSSYLDYYHPWRTHLSLNNNAPDGRTVRAADPCNVVEFPAVLGLTHVYLPKAA
jgi:transposase InsO family protein